MVVKEVAELDSVSARPIQDERHCEIERRVLTRLTLRRGRSLGCRWTLGVSSDYAYNMLVCGQAGR